VQRAKLVLYAAEGAANVEIAMRLGMNADLVGGAGGDASTTSGSVGLRIEPARAARVVFPAEARSATSTPGTSAAAA
jgi:hypothetical protein